jgi:hypothetical protein
MPAAESLHVGLYFSQDKILRLRTQLSQNSQNPWSRSTSVATFVARQSHRDRDTIPVPVPRSATVRS